MTGSIVIDEDSTIATVRKRAPLIFNFLWVASQLDVLDQTPRAVVIGDIALLLGVQPLFLGLSLLRYF